MPKKIEKLSAKELDLERNFTVIKDNKLIQNAIYNLNLMEHRIVLYLIKNVDVNAQFLETFSFSMSDFCNLYGIKFSGRVQSEFKEALLSLTEAEKRFIIEEINNKGKKTITNLSWIGTYKITDTNVEISLGQHMLEYLINLNKYFTTYNFWNIIYLRSKYSVRFYEYMKSFEYKEKVEVSVDSLKHIFQIKQEEYKYFKNYVLLKSLNEINEFTDINVEFIEVKENRKVESLIFKIKTLNEEEQYNRQKATNLGANIKSKKPVFTNLNL